MKVVATDFQKKTLERWFTVKDSDKQYLIRYTPREIYFRLIDEIQQKIRAGEIATGNFNAHLIARVIIDWRGYDWECNLETITALLENDLNGEFHAHCEAILLLCMEVSNFRDTAILLKNSPAPLNGSLTTTALITNVA